MKTTTLHIFTIALWITAGGTAIRASGVPHHFAGITVDTASGITVQLDGSVSNLFAKSGTMASQYLQMYDLYPLEASPDLSTWMRQGTLLRTIGDSTPLFWEDPNGASGMARFYRTPTNYLITAFPQPTGPYAVGKLNCMLTDPSRSNRYNIPTNSSFMCTIWYPADPPSAGDLPAPYTDPAVAKDGAWYSYFSWSSLWEPIIAASVTVAYTNASMASGTNRFPVIVHSPGYTCDRTVNSQISAELASHGYIVAAVDHIDAHCTVYPDARGARYANPATFVLNAAVGQSRTNDMECLLNTLAQFDSADPVLEGRLDLDSIGALGFSWGGGTAGEICRNDGRVKCAAFLDPALFAENGPNLIVTGLQKPFLTMNDTVVIHAALLPTPSEFSDMSSNLFGLATTNATWLKVRNASHTTFCDLGWDRDSGTGTRGAALTIDAAVLWFFDTYLKGQTTSFPTNAEIIDVHRK